MLRSYVIAMDVHSDSTQVLVTTPSGRRRESVSVRTSVPALRQIIDRTPGGRGAPGAPGAPGTSGGHGTPGAPGGRGSARAGRVVVMEEGPLAEWLVRHLSPVCDQVVVADTRRNAYIARDGDKSDVIDAAKLDQLYRANLIRPVHHRTEAERTAFKDLVMLYHNRVTERVRRTNRVIFAFRGEGLMITEKAFAKAAERPTLLKQLPGDRCQRLRWATLLDDYDVATQHQQSVRRQLISQARRFPEIPRFMQLPGVGWIRAATFYVLIDTPFRFRNKSALCKYMGIGLERRQSGAGREQVRPSPACNRPLKNMILGAVDSAIRRRESNPFQDIYERMILQAKPHTVARRTAARAMAATMWGMWKSQSTYQPDRVGQRENDRNG